MSVEPCTKDWVSVKAARCPFADVWWDKECDEIAVWVYNEWCRASESLWGKFLLGRLKKGWFYGYNQAERKITNNKGLKLHYYTDRRFFL